jgi:hypothetical protein
VTFGIPKTLEKYRVSLPGYGLGDKCNGCLQIMPRGLGVIFSDGDDWQHVSVSRRSRTPSYEDMEWIKQQFWGADACVMQLHVPKSDHVNCCGNCLHLWRPTRETIPRPPAIMVGPSRAQT